MSSLYNAAVAHVTPYMYEGLVNRLEQKEIYTPLHPIVGETRKFEIAP